MIVNVLFSTISAGDAIFLLGVATVTILCGLLRHIAFPAAAAIVFYASLFLAGIPVLFGAVSVAVGWGTFVRQDSVRELQVAVARTNAVTIEDAQGHWLGVVPSSLMYSDADKPPFIAAPIAMGDIPRVFMACAIALENTRLRSPWLSFDNIDTIALLRAWVALFTPGRRREGGSTLAEMVARELRGLTPHPHAPLLDEFSRKLKAWRDAPAIMALFPGEHLDEAVATFLPLVAGAKGSDFGGEIHGLALAARAAFAKDAMALNDGEAALLAAAINRPLLVASADAPDGIEAAKRRLEVLKNRAELCLTRAPFPESFDRDRAQAQLAAVQVPVLADFTGKLPNTPFHPERVAQRAIGDAVTDIPVALRAAAGPEWRETVKLVRVSKPQPDPTLAAEFSGAIKQVEQRHATSLQIPLWSGKDHARIGGTVVDGTDATVTEISNSGGLAGIGPQPIGSVAKIVASVLRAPSDTPQTVYVCPPSPECPSGGAYNAYQAFGLSKSATVFRRLTRNTEEEAQAGFAAFGLPAPPAGSARYNAAYGAVEATPPEVLRAAALLTGLIAGHIAEMPLPHVVNEIVLSDGSVLHPATGALDATTLSKMLASANTRNFVAQVLSAPIKMGTLRDLAGIAKTPGVTSFWGKTGTAESSDHRVRVLWNVVGVTFRGRQLTALLVVAGTNTRPVGAGIAASAMAPLTAVLIRHAMKVYEGGP